MYVNNDGSIQERVKKYIQLDKVLAKDAMVVLYMMHDLNISSIIK